MVMEPDQRRPDIGPDTPAFEKTLAGRLDDFHSTVALARDLYLLRQQLNKAAGIDVVDEDTAMAKSLDWQIKVISKVAELAGQPIDADKLRHLVSAQIQAPDNAAPFKLNVDQISTEIH